MSIVILIFFILKHDKFATNQTIVPANVFKFINDDDKKYDPVNTNKIVESIQEIHKN
jgi:hypothetical protein